MMRPGIGIWCATFACAGAVMVSAASCSSSQGPTPASSTDASFANDALATDAGIAPPFSDAPDDVAAPTDAGCSPRLGFQPTAYVPAAAVSAACSQLPTQGALVADCFADGSTYAQCSAFADSGVDAGPNGAACRSCLVTPESSDKGYGPVIQGVVPTLNIAGCIEVVDGTEAGFSCASLVQSAAACVEFACESSCPVFDDASRAAYLACTQLAANGACHVYTAAANGCVTSELEAGTGGAIQQCFDGAGDAGQALTILGDFCGH